MSRKTKRLISLVGLLTIIACVSLLSKNQISNIYGYSRAALSYYGSTGQEVTNIQSKLYTWGYYKGPVDGDYGYLTYQAIRDFQAKNGLYVDGVAGPETLAALGLASGTPQASGNNNSSYNGDTNLLARAIHGEARGEPYTGRVAVGAVIINRTRDSRFPKTIAGVIYQPGAFDAVYDGQINMEPDTESLRAARDALNGWDPTGGCIYYWNPATATSKWIWSRPIVTQIGEHVFAK